MLTLSSGNDHRGDYLLYAYSAGFDRTLGLETRTCKNFTLMYIVVASYNFVNLLYKSLVACRTAFNAGIHGYL